MDIQVLVQQQLEKIIQEGKLEAIVRAKVEKTIEEVVQDMVRSYSDFGKGLKEELTKSFKIDFERISMVDYSSIVTSIVNEQLDKHLMLYVKEPIANEIKEYVGGLDKKEWKLSEIVEIFKKEEISDEDRYSGGEITVIVERSNYGSTHIHLDERHDKKSYECEFKMSLDTKSGIPYSFDIGKYGSNRGDIRYESLHGWFSKFFFRLYAQKAVIVVDKFDTEYYHDND